jgi:N,N'-diacetyllegionaminate synthase
MTTSAIKIADHQIGQPHRAFIIAEVGINHGGDIEIAKMQISAAATAGADGVKLQTFQPELFISRASPYYNIFEKVALSDDQVRLLNKFAQEQGILLFSAVFDEPSANLWESIDTPAFKVASGDITHLPLLRHIAAFGKPMLLSTGCANMEEIATALSTIRESNSITPVALFHCVSSYPTDPADANIAAMAKMRAKFGVPVGFSDHTEGLVVPIAAAAIGAELIEKHFTHDRNADGPDHAMSVDPIGFSEMVAAIRAAESAIGISDKKLTEGEEMRTALRRSVTAFTDIPKGTIISASMLAIKRPGFGIQPSEIDGVIGRKAEHDLAADTTLSWNDLID